MCVREREWRESGGLRAHVWEGRGWPVATASVCSSVGQLLYECLFLCPRLVEFPIFTLQRDDTLSEWQSVA